MDNNSNEEAKEVAKEVMKDNGMIPQDNVITAEELIKDTVIGDKLNEMTIPKEVRIKDVPKEVEIQFLKNPTTGNVFTANSDLLKRKDLKACDQDGNLVPDNRRFGRFNS